MKWQERDALIELNDAIEGLYTAALLLEVSGRECLATELDELAQRIIAARARLQKAA